jgi:hypothetical protein
MENLRQICIRELTEDEPLAWWNYIAAFNSTCHFTDITKDCSSRAMKEAKIS